MQLNWWDRQKRGKEEGSVDALVSEGLTQSQDFRGRQLHSLLIPGVHLLYELFSFALT